LPGRLLRVHFRHRAIHWRPIFVSDPLGLGINGWKI
jgi:hypothetical protein